jgi:hypothetical protein
LNIKSNCCITFPLKWDRRRGLSQIKFSVFSALFTAKRDKKLLKMKHLVRGMERELMKEGRTLSNREREKLIEHAE